MTAQTGTSAVLDILRSPARGIRWKIVFPYAVLVFVLAAAGTYIATGLVQDSLDERFNNQLVQASRAASDAIVRQEDEHLSTARSVAFTQGVPQAVEARDSDRVLALVQGIAANSRTEQLAVLDASGRWITGLGLTDPQSSAYRVLNPDPNATQWAVVEAALESENGEKFAQIVQTSSRMMLITAAPIEDEAGTVGVVLVGTSLETTVNRIKAQALADVTLYDFNGLPLASTIVQDAESADLAVSSQLLVSTSRDTVVREHRNLWQRETDLLYGELRVRGALVGYYSVALPSDFIFDARNDARMQMTVLFTVGMLIVLVVGLLVAWSLTRRIQELVTSAERVTAGDLTTRTRVNSRDELGKLGDCVNRMTDRLEGQYMATMRALASAVAGSDPYTLRHSLRVGDLAAKLGRHMQVDERTRAQLEIGGYLHDVGKIGARDSGVLEAAHLAPRHRAHVDSHPHIGIESPSVDVNRPVLDFLGHSEANESGKQAAMVARIVAVADIYDALTADRPDGLPLTSEEALVVMRALTGEALHPGTVEALAEILPGWEREQGRGSDYKALRDAPTEPRTARSRRAERAVR